MEKYVRPKVESIEECSIPDEIYAPGYVAGVDVIAVVDVISATG